MIFTLNTTEMLDWQECWCFRCARDHQYSHVEENGDGCPLVLDMLIGNDARQWVPHGADWHTIPASVECSAFVPCEAPECQDGPNAERRNGETRREFHDRMRREIIGTARLDELGALA